MILSYTTTCVVANPILTYVLSDFSTTRPTVHNLYGTPMPRGNPGDNAFIRTYVWQMFRITLHSGVDGEKSGHNWWLGKNMLEYVDSGNNKVVRKHEILVHNMKLDDYR
jgi:hypothetical protein